MEVIFDQMLVLLGFKYAKSQRFVKYNKIIQPENHQYIMDNLETIHIKYPKTTRCNPDGTKFTLNVFRLIVKENGYNLVSKSYTYVDAIGNKKTSCKYKIEKPLSCSDYEN